MLDTYVLRQQPAYPQHIESTTHEHKAPTDESIKLLREMEEKARAQIILQVRLPDGPTPIAAFVSHDPLRGGTWFAVKVKVGGTEKVLKWHSHVEYSQDHHKAMDEIFKGCCEAVASELMEGVMRELLKTIRR